MIACCNFNCYPLLACKVFPSSALSFVLLRLFWYLLLFLLCFSCLLIGAYLGPSIRFVDAANYLHLFLMSVVSYLWACSGKSYLINWIPSRSPICLTLRSFKFVYYVVYVFVNIYFGYMDSFSSFLKCKPRDSVIIRHAWYDISTGEILWHILFVRYFFPIPMRFTV